MLWGLSPHVTEDDVSFQFVSTAMQPLFLFLFPSIFVLCTSTPYSVAGK